MKVYTIDITAAFNNQSDWLLLWVIKALLKQSGSDKVPEVVFNESKKSFLTNKMFFVGDFALETNTRLHGTKLLLVSMDGAYDKEALEKFILDVNNELERYEDYLVSAHESMMETF